MTWKQKTKTPWRKGWYLTRTDYGFVSWRAWGHGEWWKQLSDGGWISWYDGDGVAMRFEWLPSPRMSVNMDQKQLPDAELTLAKLKCGAR